MSKTIMSLLAITVVAGLAACIQEYSADDHPCPCADGWVCCDKTDTCIREGEPCLGGDTDWDPVDTNYQATVTGRLWVSPNPIRYLPDQEGGEPFHLAVSVACIGNEPLQTDGFSLEGSGDFVFDPNGDDIPNRSLDCSARPECNGASGMGFSIIYTPSGDPQASATLVVHTSDPTSPTVRVPIIPGEADQVPPSANDGYMPMQDESNPMVKPNPIRFDVGTPQEIPLCLSGMGAEVTYTGVRVYGEGYSMVGPLPTVQEPFYSGDGHGQMRYVTVRYDPENGGPEDGTVLIDLVDTWGDELQLAIPVIIR